MALRLLAPARWISRTIGSTLASRCAVAGIVYGNESHAGIHSSDERDVAAKPVEASNNEGGLVAPARFNGFRQRRPLIVLAALDLGMLGNQLP
jgi:hypothetical protein